MSELSKKRVRTSLKAIAQFKRACILSSSLTERCKHVNFLSTVYMAFSFSPLSRIILCIYSPFAPPRMVDGLIFQKNLIAFSLINTYHMNLILARSISKDSIFKNMNFFIIFWQRGVSKSAKLGNSVTLSECVTELPDSQVTPSPRETEVFRGLDIG
jgi:hypothetical protein